MKFVKVSLLLVVMTMAGCASVPMDMAPDQAVPSVSANQSQVVFLRSSFLGSAIAASMYEIDGNETEFLGIISNSTRIAVTTTPGEHTYMVIGESADFLKANLDPGKTYYVIVTPRMGAWKARFSLWPISTDSEAEFNTADGRLQEWLEETKQVVMSDAARNWYEQNKPSIEQKKTKYWPAWNEKSPEDQAMHSLKPSDGM